MRDVRSPARLEPSLPQTRIHPPTPLRLTAIPTKHKPGTARGTRSASGKDESPGTRSTCRFRLITVSSSQPAGQKQAERQSVGSGARGRRCVTMALRHQRGGERRAIRHPGPCALPCALAGSSSAAARAEFAAASEQPPLECRHGRVEQRRDPRQHLAHARGRRRGLSSYRREWRDLRPGMRSASGKWFGVAVMAAGMLMRRECATVW